MLSKRKMALGGLVLAVAMVGANLLAEQSGGTYSAYIPGQYNTSDEPAETGYVPTSSLNRATTTQPKPAETGYVPTSALNQVATTQPKPADSDSAVAAPKTNTYSAPIATAPTAEGADEEPLMLLLPQSGQFPTAMIAGSYEPAQTVSDDQLAQASDTDLQGGECIPTVVGEDFSRAEPVPGGGYASWQTACLIEEGRGVVTWELLAEPSQAKSNAENMCTRSYGGVPLFTISNCPSSGSVASGFAYPEAFASIGEAIEGYHVWGGCSDGDQETATWNAIELCELKSGCPCVDGRITRYKLD